jgi:hypothetical protein
LDSVRATIKLTTGLFRSSMGIWDNVNGHAD